MQDLGHSKMSEKQGLEASNVKKGARGRQARLPTGRRISSINSWLRCNFGHVGMLSDSFFDICSDPCPGVFSGMLSDIFPGKFSMLTHRAISSLAL